MIVVVVVLGMLAWFVVRTFFFVVFGTTLDPQALLDEETLIIGCPVVSEV